MSEPISIKINNHVVKFEQQNHRVFCTSMDIARVFGKRHDHVLRDIENILNDLREIGTSYELPNFREVVRISKTTNPKNGKPVNRKIPMYNLTRDGFSLLAMGFTGKKALKWKMSFLDAFNQMERSLYNQFKISDNKYLIDLMKQIYPHLPSEDYRVDVKITQYLNPKESREVFSLNYLVDNRKPKDPMAGK
ncbi:TPA: Rha family transcriptional regulator [Campylobacter coli]|nr:Rha family transcriptional regulator [Campylobacter coli]HEH4956915.1 Rha family transcriptional regulator [Campylobacter coli]